ncbi:Hypothetical predicted protein [Octopus vulgaris]|uniref:Uncharacterized protein n=1 Tax=Octopus vulgaris TaxID=6645 RepID=A0AA36F444_OCTVU|nr:Hypothetical predicted protein [Octopus vulgaris]
MLSRYQGISKKGRENDRMMALSKEERIPDRMMDLSKEERIDPSVLFAFYDSLDFGREQERIAGKAETRSLADPSSPMFYSSELRQVNSTKPLERRGRKRRRKRKEKEKPEKEEEEEDEMRGEEENSSGDNELRPFSYFHKRSMMSYRQKWRFSRIATVWRPLLKYSVVNLGLMAATFRATDGGIA